MKNALWFLIGVISGFAAAHLVSKDPRGHELLADIDARIAEFTDRVTDAYRSQEAKFEGVLGDVQHAASDALESAKAAASDAADKAQALAADAADAASQAAKKLTD